MKFEIETPLRTLRAPPPPTHNLISNGSHRNNASLKCQFRNREDPRDQTVEFDPFLKTQSASRLQFTL